MILPHRHDIQRVNGKPVQKIIVSKVKEEFVSVMQAELRKEFGNNLVNFTLKEIEEEEEEEEEETVFEFIAFDIHFNSVDKLVGPKWVKMNEFMKKYEIEKVDITERKPNQNTKRVFLRSIKEKHVDAIVEYLNGFGDVVTNIVMQV